MAISLTTPEMQQNPYPAYARMQQNIAPVLVEHTFSDRPVYFVSRHDDVVRVLKDQYAYVNDARKLPAWDDWTKKWYIPPAFKGFVNSMALVDEPDHSRLRQLVHQAFTPSRVQAINQRMEMIADDLLDKMAKQRQVDFVQAYALPFPVTVIGEMLGISEDEMMKFHRWMRNPMSTSGGSGILSMIPQMINTLRLSNFLKGMIKARRRNPQDDLTSALVQAEAKGDKLSEEELFSMLFLMLFAGQETTVSFISSSVLALLQQPEQFEMLKANPDLMDSAIDELLRYTSPTQHVAYRYNLQDVEIGGITIPQHSMLLIGIGAANHDANVFTNPERLDLTRNPNRHVAFGFGVHYCLGAPLARMEARVAFQKLFERFPNMQLATAPDKLQWRGMPALRGLIELPLRLR